MGHDEFVERSRDSRFVWGVRGFWRPVFLVWGPGSLVALGVATLILAGALVTFGIYAIRGGEYVAVAWLVPAAVAWRVGRPDLNCAEGMLWLFSAIAGLVASLFLGALHAMGGILPGLIWVASGAFKGTLMVYMHGRLRESPETYRKLQESGLLILPARDE